MQIFILKKTQKDNTIERKVNSFILLRMKTCKSLSFYAGFYYGKSTDVTQAAAKSQCESLGLRLAVFHTQTDWEKAKAFLNEYHAKYT